ncbi:protein phosphatase 1, regulatory subunit 3Da [Poecilia latipinna]|uniref:protein phosphatase 1, regulatory subunit 3Da n=1 Tax=Poecilia latipinna TaxID=48699 RepID=UPI00072EC3F3|nr:PREDICTED: protein phosphatase 1 regulatory subunit 3D-like [Poecilia latipinna]
MEDRAISYSVSAACMQHASYLCTLRSERPADNMEREWFLGHERIHPPKSQQPLSSCSGVSRPFLTVNVNEMLRADKPNTIRKPVPIRPPSPRVTRPKGQDSHSFLTCEPTPKPIIRQRSRSLPSGTQNKKKQSRGVGVRFIDSLGLDLEDVRVFKSGEDPFVPQHVTFRLLMGAEMTDGRHLEINLPYLKPVFAQQPGDQPEFLQRLHEQKVCLERVLCFELGIIGITQVLNLDFEKEVEVRYSFTEWKSSAETKASWVSTVTKTCDGEGGRGEEFSCDTFRFHLPVPPSLRPGAQLEFAIQYKVCGAEYWDNNDGKNYKLVCQNYKLAVPKECEDSMVHFI